MYYDIITLVVLAVAFGSVAVMVKGLRGRGQVKNRVSTDEAPSFDTPASDSAAKAPQPFTTFSAAYPSDKSSWDSLADHREGEDPCHDDMQTIAATEESEPAAQARPVFSANDLAKGFVIGEILNRKRR